MKATAVLALITGLLALTGACIAALSYLKRRKEGSKVTSWDDVQSLRDIFMKPSRLDLWAIGLMFATTVPSFIAAAHS